MISRNPIIIDTNLLVLLVVGSTSLDFIASHKRTTEYDIDAFRVLEIILEGTTSFIANASTLAETSNFIREFREPGRSAVVATFDSYIKQAAETSINAVTAISRPEYRVLGFTDAIILEMQKAGSAALITDDLDLYVASVTAGYEAYNFSHIREKLLGL